MDYTALKSADIAWIPHIVSMKQEFVLWGVAQGFKGSYVKKVRCELFDSVPVQD